MNPATIPTSSTEHTIEFIRKNRINPSLFMLLMEHPIIPIRHRFKIQRGPEKGKVPQWGEQRMTYSKDPNDENWLIKHFIHSDEGVGQIREEIENLGLAKNTVLWFISDNGGTAGNKTTSRSPGPVNHRCMKRAPCTRNCLGTWSSYSRRCSG